MTGTREGFDPAVLARCRLPLKKTSGTARAGLTCSSRPGPGSETHSVRPYEFGDDPRRVDWNASARTGEMQVRTSLSDVTVGLHLIPLLDGSMRFGSRRTKHETATEALAFLAAVAAHHGNSVTLQTRPENRLRLPSRSPQTHLLTDLLPMPLWEDQSRITEVLSSLRPTSTPTLLVVVADLLSLPATLPAIDPAGRGLLLLLVVDPLELSPPVNPPSLSDVRGTSFRSHRLSGRTRSAYIAEIERRVAMARQVAARHSGTFMLLRTDESVPAHMLTFLGERR